MAHDAAHRRWWIFTRDTTLTQVIDTRDGATEAEARALLDEDSWIEALADEEDGGITLLDTYLEGDEHDS